MIEIEEQNMLQQTINTDGYVFIDYYATWCGPCKKIAPKIEAMSEKYDKITFAKCDIDVIDVSKEQVSKLPTFKLYHNGVCIDTIVGANEDLINSRLSSLFNESMITQEDF